MKLARTSIFWKIFDFDGSLHGEMGSLYHVIEKNLMSFLSVALSYIYISTPFFITFYSIKVARGMVTFGKSKATKFFVIL